MNDPANSITNRFVHMIDENALPWVPWETFSTLGQNVETKHTKKEPLSQQTSVPSFTPTVPWCAEAQRQNFIGWWPSSPTRSSEWPWSGR